MRLTLSLFFLMPGYVFSQIQIVSESPRFITVIQEECEIREVYMDSQIGGSLFGGLIGGLIGKQIGGGSGKEIATVLGAIVGTNVARTRSGEIKRTQYREFCENVETQIQKGKLVTLDYAGSLHTIVVD